MRDQAAVSGVEHREVLGEPGRHVVRRQHGDRGRRGQPLGAHHPHVGPGDRQDARRAVRRRADRADALAPRGSGCPGCDGQVRRQVLAHADRADAGTAAAVRDAERLVQVEVATRRRRTRRAGRSPTSAFRFAPSTYTWPPAVHGRAELADAVLVHAVRRRVGDHDRGEVVGVLLALGAQVVEVDAAVVAGLDHDDPHAGHHRGGGVGAVRRGRDQADVALLVAVGHVVGADRQQPGELALRAGVGLDGDPVVAGDLGQPALQLADQVRRSRAASSAGANGCRSANPARLIGSISVVALSFIVQEPSGIIPRSSA